MENLAESAHRRWRRCQHDPDMVIRPGHSSGPIKYALRIFVKIPAITSFPVFIIYYVSYHGMHGEYENGTPTLCPCEYDHEKTVCVMLISSRFVDDYFPDKRGHGQARTSICCEQSKPSNGKLYQYVPGDIQNNSPEGHHSNALRTCARCASKGGTSFSYLEKLVRHC